MGCCQYRPYQLVQETIVAINPSLIYDRNHKLDFECQDIRSDRLKKELAVWQTKRNDRKEGITWSFTIEDAKKLFSKKGQN